MQSIRDAFMIFVRMVKILWDELLTLAVCNLLWLLLCLPIVTAPASFAALYSVADLAAREKPVAIRDFFAGFKAYFIKGTLLGLLNLVVGIIIAGNFAFYGQMEAGWAQVVRAIWIAIGAFWLLLQVYLLPMLVVQVEPKIGVALRNTVMLTLAQPFYTIIVALEVGALVVVSARLIVPVGIITMSLVALLSCVALNDRLAYLRRRQKDFAQPQDQ